jgi:SAM-dependent methyltransferase
MKVLSDHFPRWRNLSIHESSPGWDPVSQRLAKECGSYVASQYDLSAPAGTMVEALAMPCKRYQSENLENQTYADEQFDIVITQDVFEHIFMPGLAIKEIARTLKLGGATIMTVPLIMKQHPTRRRARFSDGHAEHVLEPQYHGNPIDKIGSLVTIDWGYDILSYLHHHSGLSFLMIKIDDIDLGIRGDLNEVIIGFKTALPVL